MKDLFVNLIRALHAQELKELICNVEKCEDLSSEQKVELTCAIYEISNGEQERIDPQFKGDFDSRVF